MTQSVLLVVATALVTWFVARWMQSRKMPDLGKMVGPSR